jgi:hypothetical protein
MPRDYGLPPLLALFKSAMRSSPSGEATPILLAELCLLWPSDCIVSAVMFAKLSFPDPSFIIFVWVLEGPAIVLFDIMWFARLPVVVFKFEGD